MTKLFTTLLDDAFYYSPAKTAAFGGRWEGIRLAAIACRKQNKNNLKRESHIYIKSSDLPWSCISDFCEPAAPAAFAPDPEPCLCEPGGGLSTETGTSPSCTAASSCWVQADQAEVRLAGGGRLDNLHLLSLANAQLVGARAGDVVRHHPGGLLVAQLEG